MAQQKMEQDKLCCSICFDLLKDPVTIPCGHSYCMNCIKSYWGEEDQKKIHSCPQCRKLFRPRPFLMKNTTLADLMEKLKMSGLQAAPGDHGYAGSEDVACDFCIGRKLKAVKSCLQCLVSYCEQHLQPHYDSPAFVKHKLVNPSKKLQENICSRHNEVMKIFCCTDQKCICYLCSMDEHKGHDTVSAAAEMTEKQRELGVSQQKIQQSIQDREDVWKKLQLEMENINHSADKAVGDIEKICTDVKQQIRSRQKTEVTHVKKLQDKVEQEIAELRRKDNKLKQLTHTEDHTQFLHNYTFLAHVSEFTDSASVNIPPLRYTEDMKVAVSEVRDELQDILSEEWTKISLTESAVEALLPQAEPKTREEFMKYACQITLDANTAHSYLNVRDIRKVECWHYRRELQMEERHPDRFIDWFQVLCREGLSGRCYWEVECCGEVFVAVAYKIIIRTGRESVFGHNDHSWAIQCVGNSYEFRHNKIRTSISGPQSSRVGVYLDHSAGILSFYSVSDTMTLLHRTDNVHSATLSWTWSLFQNLC